MSQPMPSIDAWLTEAKQDPAFQRCGMYLVHNGVVRATPKARTWLPMSCTMPFSRQPIMSMARVRHASKLHE